MKRALWLLCSVAACGESATDTMLESSSGPLTSGGTEAGSSGEPATSGSTADPDDGSSGSSGGAYVPIDCSPACADLESDAGVAVCYACRCKNAMDGVLPSVAELQCDQAEELTIYTADVSGPAPQLLPATEALGTCVNPALLTETCVVGSRLGQLQIGDVYVKWVCRDPDPATGIYADMGAIMYNARTGASCWFDDVDEVTTDDNVPDLDLMEAGEENLAAFLDRFYFVDGSTCTRDCHDADPFIYTPFFESIDWYTGPFALGPHALVELDGSLAPIQATHLVTPETTVCTTCHRLGSAAGCDWLSPDALGNAKTAAHEEAVFDAMAESSPHWDLAYWMPSGVEITSLEQWMETYGAAKDRIEECCANPGVDSVNCTWEPIPTP